MAWPGGGRCFEFRVLKSVDCALKSPLRPAMAHRWSAQKVTPWESKLSQWNLQREDALADFLATLPQPTRPAERTNVINAKGGHAQLWKFVYHHVAAEDSLLFHGTTYLSLHRILSEGLRASCDPKVHEFTVPGIYCADVEACSLYYHATATRFSAPGCPWDTPYVHILLRVQPLGRPQKVSSYGWGNQLVFEQGAVKVSQVLVYRGWNFSDKGEKVMYANDAHGLTVPVATSLSLPAVVEPPVPPPPPIVWYQYVHTASSGARMPYYHNSATGATTWEEPTEPFHAAPDSQVESASLPELDVTHGLWLVAHGWSEPDAASFCTADDKYIGLPRDAMVRVIDIDDEWAFVITEAVDTPGFPHSGWFPYNRLRQL